jgi:autotransporter-associated beta strand protein
MPVSNLNAGWLGSPRYIIALAAVACLVLAPRAAAQSGTITMTAADGGGQTSWNTGDRWSDSQAPHADADYLIDTINSRNMRTPNNVVEISTFGGKSLTLRNTTATVSENIRNNGGPLAIKSSAGSILTINDLRLESYSTQAMIKHDFGSTGTFTLAGNITLVTGTSRILLLAGSPQVTFVIGSNISGAGSLWLDNFDGASATNVFVLAGDNTYTGETWLTGGTFFTGTVTLRLDSDTALGNTSGVKLDSAGASIDLNGHNANLGALSGTWASSLITNRLAGITGTATITVAGGTTTYEGILRNAAGALAVAKAGDGTLVLTGTANGYTGDTTIHAGLLVINGHHSNAAGTVFVKNTGTLAGTGTLASPVRVENGGALLGAPGGVLTMGGLELAETSRIDIALGAPSAGALFQVNGDLVLDGVLDLTDAGGFGPGLYRIINYTGALTDHGLEIGAVPVSGLGLLLDVDTGATGQINLVYGTADFWANGSGTWNATTTNWTDITGTAAAAWGGARAIFRGPSGTITVDNDAGAIPFAVAQFAADGFLLTGGTLQTGGTAVLRVGDGTPAGSVMSATIATAIGGAGGIEKTDHGTLVLAGGNTYTGATVVRNGALLINGSQGAATGAVTVKADGVLGGTGVIGGAVQVENGGALAAAQGGTLTMPSLVLAETASLDVTLDAPGNTTALLQVNGDLTLDGWLNITDAGGFGAGLYRIIDYTGALTDHGLEIGDVPAPGIEPLLSVETGEAGRVNLLYGVADIWNGGDATWSSGSLWDSGSTVPWNAGFAIFRGTPGIITVSNAAGPVVFTGAQFTADGFLIDGGTLTTDTPNTVLRVGDGTPAGATVSATIAATISGAGGIEKTDLGTLVLEGGNTYLGATVVKAGTLLINGGQSAATGNATVRSGAALGGAGIMGADVTVENGGVLLGRSGGVLAMGGLTLNDSSVVSVALGASSEASLFQVNGDLVLDGVLDITDAGGLGPGLYRLFNYTGALTDHGLEFGSMPAGATGAESLLTIDTSVARQVSLLYGTADFWLGGSGTWNADPGNLNWKDSTNTSKPWAGSFAIFNAGSGTVTVNGADDAPVKFNGAQFAVNGYTIDGNMIVATTAPSIIRVGDGTGAGAGITAVISAEIGGTGGIDKTDLGTLVISGKFNQNTYTGATRIKEGTLRLADGGAISDTAIHSGARLEGSGVVRGDLRNDGVLAPAAGAGAAIQVGGDFTQTANGTLVASLATPTSFSQVHVDGSVSLDGDLIVAIPDTGFAPVPGLALPIINAGGAISGTFASMDAPWGRLSQMVVFEILYGARTVSLSFTQLPFAGLNGTENQRAIGAGIDGAISRGAIPGLQAALNTIQTEAEILATLNLLSPQAYERYFSQAIYSMDAGVRSIEGRLASPFMSKNRWNLWAEALARTASFAGSEDLASADSRSYGMQAGVDRAFGERVKLGVFLSITDDDLGRRLGVTRHLAGVYGRLNLGRAFVDVVAGGGAENIDAARVTRIPGRTGLDAYQGLASAGADAGEYFGSARLGLVFDWGKSTRFVPYAAVRSAHWEVDAFDESGASDARGANDAALRIREMKGDSFTTRLGFELSRSFAWKKTTLTPRLNLAWRREFEDDARDIAAEIGGSPFVIRSTKPERDGVLAGLTLDASLSPRVTAWIGFSYENSTAIKNACDTNAGIMWKF